jgi:hypothetical protein
MFNPLRKIRELALLSQRISSSGGTVGGAVLSVGGPDGATTQLPVAISTIVYVAMFFNFVMWTWYGALAPNFIVFVQNGLGLLLTVYYIRKWQQLGQSSAPGPGGSLVSLYPAWLSAPSRMNGAMLSLGVFASILGLLTMQQTFALRNFALLGCAVRLNFGLKISKINLTY